MADEPLLILTSAHKRDADYLELIIAEGKGVEKVYKVKIGRLMMWQNTIAFHLNKKLKNLLEKQ